MIATIPARFKNTFTTNSFYQDVVKGLTAFPKFLDAKYFYNGRGDRLFQQIMECPEYYPTRCEMEIVSHQGRAIVHTVQKQAGNHFDVVELGAGDATKSIHLLKELLHQQVTYTYYPIDISADVIDHLHQHLPQTLPQLQLQGLNGEYMEMLLKAGELSGKNKLVLFMGANIGNFDATAAAGFCRQLRKQLHPGDLLLIGFDLKKHPQVILDAYNDQQGITRTFNLNLLQRINEELGANFNLEGFMHYPTYDPLTGACKSYLISLRQQKIHLNGGISISFEENEPVYMEISQKYSLVETEQLAAATGFRPVARFLDQKAWFADCLWACS